MYYKTELFFAMVFVNKPCLSAWGRSSAEIVGSNPTGGMDICLLW